MTTKLAQKQRIARLIAEAVSLKPPTATSTRIQQKEERAMLIAEAREMLQEVGHHLQKGVDKLKEKKQIAKANGNVVQYSEVNRIVSLPIIHPMDEFELEEFNRQYINAARFEAGWRLFPVQAEALMAYEATGGGLFPIGVGWGKTLTTLMIANAAYKKGLQKIILLVEPNILSQLVGTDIPWARSRVAINFPIHVLGGKSMRYRKMLSKSGKRGLYIIPYSCLSTKDASENLNWIQPQLVIADEAHNIGKQSAARTKRILEAIDEYKSELVALSGTITSKTIKDYYHLIKRALKEGSPLPMSTHMANDWAQIIDASASRDGNQGAATGPLTPLIVWAQRHFPDDEFSEDIPGFRRAYKVRLNSVSGVVSSGDNEIGTSLELCNNPVEDYEKNYPSWPKLKEHIDEVENEWLTPNGDEIEHAIHAYKWLYELSAGFYNKLSWPTVEVYASRKGISKGEAEDILRCAQEYHLAGQEYASALRKWLEYESKPGLDTPFLVGSDMAHNQYKHVGHTLYELWSKWKALDFEDRPDRDSTAVRVCPYKIDAAVLWARSLKPGTGGIVWVWHQEMGLWAAERMAEMDVDVLHCPAGKQYNDLIRDPANGHKIMIASISAHGTGKNLQHFQEQYFLQWPRQASKAEQALGRTHRNGQKADKLIVNTNNTLEFDQLNFAACLNDALYIHQTTGNRQKLIYASYNPMPKIFPHAVLNERGYQAKMLNAEQNRLFMERFSKDA